ncbi:MAG: replication-relaxation family protein [Nitrospiraceae bacterium]|nr:replication-relaxation family protein [Nitrospiraceae bacterium]
MPAEPEELIQGDDEAGDSTPGRLVLVPGDTDIFKLIYDYRFLRTEHISALTGRAAKRVHRRLFKLIHAGYLTSIRLPQQKHIYGLGKKAGAVLVEEGIAQPELLSERLRAHELKELFLKHEMMLVDLHVILALASRESDLRLVAWQEGRKLFDYVSVQDHDGVRKLPVRPDAFFTIEDSRRPDGANRAHFFLEIDRSTENQTRFKEKISAYWHYLEQGLHARKFGIKNFRILTVTLTDSRAKNLCDLAGSLLPERARKYYFFSALKNFSLENPAPILGDVYFSPRPGGSETRYPLVPPPTPS